MDKESIEILEFIRDNPLCASGAMDGFILKDLHDMGYIEAVDVTTDDSEGIPEFIEMRITLSGKNAISENDETSNKTEKEPHEVHDWHNKPLGKIAVGAITGVIVILCGYLISKHFGIS